MKRRTARMWLPGILLAFTLASAVLAQVSTHNDLSWYVFSGGGGERESANALWQDSSGQWVSGISGSPNFRIETGFVFGIASETPLTGNQLFLPLILKE